MQCWGHQPTQDAKSRRSPTILRAGEEAQSDKRKRERGGGGGGMVSTKQWSVGDCENQNINIAQMVNSYTTDDSHRYTDGVPSPEPTISTLYIFQIQ